MRVIDSRSRDIWRQKQTPAEFSDAPMASAALCPEENAFFGGAAIERVDGRARFRGGRMDVDPGSTDRPSKPRTSVKK